MSPKSCFLFHKWDGCKCSVCGKTRNEGHDFAWGVSVRDHGACRRYCRKCGYEEPGTKAPHDFVKKPGSCVEICSRCGTQGQTRHDYEKPEGRCVLRCRVCGSETELSHTFEARLSADGRCEQHCTWCGFTRPGHTWYKTRGCRCTVCGVPNPKGDHFWKIVTEGNMTNIRVCECCGARDESEMCTLSEAKVREAMIRADQLHEMRAAGFKA